MRQRQVGAALFLIAIAAVLVLAFISPLREWLTVEGLRSISGEVAAMIQARPIAWIAGFAIACMVATSVSFPIGPIIGLLGGALFGFWTGLLVVLLASSIGSTVAFLAARSLLRGWVEAKFGERLRSIDEGVARRGAAYLLVLRFNPFVPYWLVNLAMGLTKMPLATYYPLTLIGLAPAIGMYAFAGTKLASLSSLSEIMSPALVGALVLLSLFPLMLRRFDAWRERAPA